MLVQQALITFSYNAIPVLLPPITQHFGIEPGMLGVYTSVLFAVGILAGVTSGGFILRFGAFRMSQICLASAGLGMLLAGFGWLWMFLPAAILLGIGMGPSTPASSHILARFATPKVAPLVFSIKQTGVPFGSGFAGLVLPAVVILYGWQGALFGGAAMCWLMALTLWPLHRRYDDDRQPNRRLTLADVGLAVKTAFSSRNMAELAFAGFAFSGLQVAFISYFVTYLVEAIDQPYAVAGEMLAWSSGVAIVGRIFWGLLAGNVVQPRPLLAFLSFAMVGAAIAVGMLDSDSSYLAIMLSGIAMGATAVSWNGVHLAEVARLAPKGNASVATAGVIFCCFCGLFAVPGIFGLVVAASGDYDLGFYLAAVPCALTGIVMLRRAT
jgi:MFS family permease